MKLSPILLIPPFAWILGRSHLERGLLAAGGMVGFLVLISPFLGTRYFWDHGLLGRQVGQVPNVPMGIMVVLYICYLALVAFAARWDAQRVRVLLFSFLALHALLYLLPGWNPQRAVLFIAALCVAAPIRRWFLLPYLSVTAFALVLGLEHRNELASGLFEPLTTRVLLIPPLIDSARIEPVHSLLFGVGGVAWAAALASLWFGSSIRRPALRWSPAIPLLLMVSLVAYLAASFWLLPRGVQATPYTSVAAPQPVAAGETFSFAFISGQDDLRAITLWLDTGPASAAVRVADGEGRSRYFRAAQQLLPGPNRMELGHIHQAGGRAFRVSLTPARALRVGMVEVPPTLDISSAELNGSPLPGTAAYTLDHKTTWSGLVEDGLSQLRAEWQALAVSVAICGAALAAMGFLRR